MGSEMATHGQQRNRFAAALASQPYLLLDGALATELEKQGCNLSSDKLWSARVLIDNPELIYKTHLAYFLAGAHVVITASYQASTRGLEEAGLSDKESVAVLERSVALAVRAREQATGPPPTQPDALAPSASTNDTEVVPPDKIQNRFIAGSIGPYGAYLADGSEYTGSYSPSIAGLKQFHRPRMHALLEAGVDILACETVPSLAELEALLLLFDELDAYAWISITLKDSKHMSDGTPLAQVGRLLDAAERVLAFGVNCVPPELVSGALQEFRGVSSKPFVVYPNSGEVYDAIAKQWVDAVDDDQEGSQEHWIAQYVNEWYALGARVIGTCCRTGPDDTKAIKEALVRVCMHSDLDV